MSTERNFRIRFARNNFAALIAASIEKSSELSSFPATNSVNSFRSKVWTPSGRFQIGTTNDTIYFNDGSNKEATITNQEYLTPASLAEEIQTQLNTVSSNFICTYSSSTYKFTISNTGSVTLRLSESANSSWKTLGFDTNIDVTSTSFEADKQMNHYPNEYISFDMGYNASMSFFSMIGPLSTGLTLSNVAEVKLLANNLNDFNSPPFEQTLTINERGMFLFMDNLEDTAYRFWRLEINDPQNYLGPEGLKIGHIYIGDYDTTTVNFNRDFSKTLIDPSEKQVSESGAIYFNRKTKYTEFENLEIKYLPREEKDILEQLFYDVGIHTPFYISLDPLTNISTTKDEFTKYVLFEGSPQFTSFRNGMFHMSFKLTEAI